MNVYKSDFYGYRTTPNVYKTARQYKFGWSKVTVDSISCMSRFH